VKNQYFGDINDYRKYGILRGLAKEGTLSLGVCWMLTPDDGRGDGGFTQYLSDPSRWRKYDPVLFDALHQSVAVERRRDVAVAPVLDLIPGARYFDLQAPEQDALRKRYLLACLQALAACEVLFFDPDNGIEVVSCPYGSRGSGRYVYWRELGHAFRDGHSVLVYQHYPRVKRELFHSRISAQLQAHLGPAGVYGLVTSSVVYFLAVQPHHLNRAKHALALIGERWQGEVTVLDLLGA
jgi:hypothetical protein